MTAACHSIAKTEHAIQIWQFVYLLATKTLGAKRDIILLNYLVTACKHDKRYSMLLSCKCNHIQPNRYYHTTIGHYSMSSNYNLSITNLRWIKIVSSQYQKNRQEKKNTKLSHTMFTREIMAKTAESVIKVVCKPLVTSSFARRCPWYLVEYQLPMRKFVFNKEKTKIQPAKKSYFAM